MIGTTFGSLRVRNYRLFAIGQLVKLIGTWMLFTAQDWLVLQMRTGELFRDGRTPARRDTGILDGLRYVYRRPDLSQAILLVLVVGLFGFNFQLTLAVLAKNVFHTDARLFGLLSTALAVGALSGALASSRRRGRPS